MSDTSSVNQIEENELTAAVVTKYQTAADIANRSLQKVIAACVEGAKILDLCQLGDQSITDISKTVFNKGKVPKGIAFPTCVSTGTAVCHMSPIPSDPEASIVLKKGELVRIQLGAHVDGYISQVAHTLVVGATKEAPATGLAADVILAAHTASEAAIRLLKPGKKNFEVTETIEKVLEDFNCKGVEGMLSQQTLRNQIDGQKVIILNPSDNQRKEIEEFEFEEGQVFGLDIVVSTGTGKTRILDTRSTVYKKTEATYALKMKTSRAVYTQISKDCGNMVFSLRQLEDEKKARMGIVECANHNLVTPYPVLHEKEDALVGHFSYTVLLMPNGPLKLSSSFDATLISSEKKPVNEEVVALLSQSIRASKKKKKANK